MGKDDYKKVVEHLTEAAKLLHRSDSGHDWSRAFQIQDLAKEISKENGL